MGQIITNRTGRVKIFHSGVNPEIVIKAEQKKKYLLFRAELNLDPKHKFNNDFAITLQAYEKNGLAKVPLDMGTVGKPIDLAYIIVEYINIDSILFRLKITDNKNVIKGWADQISITLDDNFSEGAKALSDQSDTILPIQETDQISTPFKLQMIPNERPKLLLKARLNLKEKFKREITTKVFIYTSVIRQILFTYLADEEFNDDPKKKQFLQKIKDNAGGDLEDPPEDIMENNKITDEGHEWIEKATSLSLSKPISFNGKNTSLMDEFTTECKKYGVGDEDEN
jgi:hypothetical protein